MSLKWFQYFVKTLKVALQFQISFIGVFYGIIDRPTVSFLKSLRSDTKIPAKIQLSLDVYFE
jgi:hypothetical protein